MREKKEKDGLVVDFLKAYRWQYIFSGATHPRFQAMIKGLITPDQIVRIEAALASLGPSAG